MGSREAVIFVSASRRRRRGEPATPAVARVRPSLHPLSTLDPCDVYGGQVFRDHLLWHGHRCGDVSSYPLAAMLPAPGMPVDLAASGTRLVVLAIESQTLRFFELAAAGLPLVAGGARRE